MRIGRLNSGSPFETGICYGPLMAGLGAIAPALSAVGTVVGLVGTAVQAQGTLAAGNAAQAAAQSQAMQLDQQATQQRAAAQRQMFEHQRQTDLVQSQLQARAAASGGGATDDTVLGLQGGIAERGEYQALGDLYNGENAARGLEDQAKAKIASGDAAQAGSVYSAIGTIAGGIGSGFQKFAGLGYPGGNYYPGAPMQLPSAVSTG